MSHTIAIPQQYFKAVSFAMAKADIRYYLNGVCLQHNGEETRLIATDGHRLHMVRIEHNDGLVVAPIEVIIPDTLVRIICKAKVPKRMNHLNIVLTIDGDKVSASLPDGTESIAKLLDGRFPDYRRVLPDSFSGEIAQYNPDYVADAIAGYRAFTNSNFTTGFNFNGDGCGGICCQGFAAIVMPWRADCVVDGLDKMKAPMREPETMQEIAA